MFHHPNVDWTSLQAEAMSLRHEIVSTNEENELVKVRESLAELKQTSGISGVVSGAVASDFQKTRFDNICDTLELKSYAPLWHKDPKTLVHDLTRAGFKIIFTAVAARGLDESWLGREITQREWSQLETLTRTHGINLTGEGGEYESFVLDAPQFSKAVSVEDSQKHWRGDSGQFLIVQASLRDKLGN